MKALVLAAALAALTSSAPAGIARDAGPRAQNKIPMVVMADASRLSSAGLTALNNGNRWTPEQHHPEPGAEFDALAAQVDNGTLYLVLSLLGLASVAPVRRSLRRQEQQRRAAALAATLGTAHKG